MLLDIAEEHGTPTHVLDLDCLASNYDRLQEGLSRCICPFKILYSFKTNYLPIILEKMKNMGAGADVVSGYEMEAALVHGFGPHGIVFNGPMKTEAELARAMENNALVNIDGPDEMECLQTFSAALGVITCVGLRVNPGLNVYASNDPSYNQIATEKARKSKFGWLIEKGEAEKMAARVGRRPNLKLSAIHCHLGSQITSTPEFSAAVGKVIQFVAELRKRFPIQTLNIGGGFGVTGIHREKRGPLQRFLEYQGLQIIEERRERFDLTAFVDMLNHNLSNWNLTDLTLACEPGRVLVSGAMALITRVVSLKNVAPTPWMILDGGLHLLPTVSLGEDHEMFCLNKSSRSMREYHVGGPMCFEGDVLSWAKKFPVDMQTGDFVVIKDTGAYTVSRSTNFIRPRAAVVALKNGLSQLCWRRETYEDIFSFQVMTSL